MNRRFVIAAMIAVAGTGAAIAQTGERSLLDAKKFWTAGGSLEESKSMKDPKVPGEKVLKLTSTGEGSRYGVNASQRISNAYKKGERIVITSYLRAEKPTRIWINVDLMEPPYTSVGRQQVDVGTEWKEHRVEFVSPSDQDAGTTRVVVQLNTEARTVYFGKLGVTAAPAS